MKCIMCGTENQEGAIQCINCGNVLGGTTVQPVPVVNSQVLPVSPVTATPIVEPQIASVAEQASVVIPSQSIVQPVQPVVETAIPQVNPTSVVEQTPVVMTEQPVVQSGANFVQPVVETPVAPVIENSQFVQPTVTPQVMPVLGTESTQQPVGNIGSVAPVNPNFSNEEKGKTKKKKLKLILIILIVVLVITVGVCIFFFIKGQQILEQAENMFNEDTVQITWTPSKYEVGAEVTLVDNSSWYVLSENGDIITLFAKDYYGERTHFSDIRCEYDVSIPKKILETTYLSELSTSLTNNGGNVEGLKARLITVEEIRKIAGVSNDVPSDEIELDSTYRWLYNPGAYWTSTNTVSKIEEGLLVMYYVESWNNTGNVVIDDASGALMNGREFYIRPVIELNVSNIKA